MPTHVRHLRVAPRPFDWERDDDATFDLAVDRDAPGTSDDDSDAQLAAIDFHHQQTRI